MPDLTPTLTLAVKHRCSNCSGAGYVPQEGHAILCPECRGRGEWEEAVTLEELAQQIAEWIMKGQSAASRPAMLDEGDGLPLGRALAMEHEARVRKKGRR